MTEKIFIELEKHHRKRALAIGKKLMSKPKFSPFILFFPFILIPYYYELKKYENSLRIFVEEFLFTKKIALELLKNDIREENLPNIIKEKIFKDDLYKDIYIFQEKEIIEIFKNKGLTNYDIIEAEIKIIQISREICNLKDASLEFSCKLEHILRAELSAL